MRVQTWIRTHKAHEVVVYIKLCKFQFVYLFLTLALLLNYKRILERRKERVLCKVLFLLQSMFDQDLIIFTSLSLPPFCPTSNVHFIFPVFAYLHKIHNILLRNIIFSLSILSRFVLFFLILCTQPISVVSVCSVHKLSKPNSKLSLS